MRMGQRLYSFVVDERAVPELEVQEAPDSVAAFGAALGVIAQQAIDGRGIDDAALARARVEEHVARDAVPAAARPLREGDRESHLRPVENRLRQQSFHRLA